MAQGTMGTMILLESDSKGPNDAIYADEISFVGPADYTGDGIGGFETEFRKHVGGSQRKVLNVLQISACGGYQVWWDAAFSGTTRGTGILRLYYGSGGSPAAAGTETSAAAPAPARPSFPASTGAGTAPIDPALLIKGGIAVVALVFVVAIIFGIRAISSGPAKPTAEIKATAQQTITLIARDTVRVKLVQELDGAELFQGTLIKGEPRTFTKRGSLLLTATALQNVDIEINGKRQPNPYSGYDRVQIP